MCGIAGILSPKPLTIIEQGSEPQGSKLISADFISDRTSRLKAMQTALRHRGPDGQGTYFSESYQAALCHTRLSIIDLSDAGRQPMSSKDQRYTITFNGEIYNYKKLRAQLEIEGEKFQSDSDTEVILKLFAKKGAECIAMLRGMFALVIWDEQEQQGFAARDALGIKPFYYLKADTSLVFASELRAVLASGLSSNKLSSRGLMSYFLSGTVAEPDTLIKNIKMLPAGTYMTWKAGKSKISRYWKLDFTPQNITPAKAVEVTRTALERSVRAHLVGDVPVGIFLSGGIDSTALVAIASQLSKTKINTYSIAFEDPEWNEGDVAKRVADHFGTNHTEFIITADLAKPLFERFLGDIDQPTIDCFNTYCVSMLASQNGEKVVLSGLGADELFAGYKSFELLPKMVRKTRLFRPIAFLLKPLNRLLNKSLSPRLRRISDAVCHPGSLAAAQQSLRGIFSIEEARQLTTAICKRSPKELKLIEPTHSTQADKISYLELTNYCGNQLLRDSDIASMAWGLELRVPFIDRVFVEQISSIPSELRLQYGKKLLIESVPELPSWVINRPKQGFRFPFDEWFEASWKNMDMPETPPWITLTPWYRRWSIAVLNDWKARYAK